jgi:ElaB/YqjD/DUF883 family membrane-anchored ribosome-binding protein
MSERLALARVTRPAPEPSEHPHANLEGLTHVSDTNLSTSGQQGRSGQGGTGESSDLMRDLGLLREDITKLSESVTSMLSGQAGVATTQLRDAAGEAYETVSQAAGSFSRAGSGLYEDASKRLDTLGSELTGTIQRAPITALAVAAMLGMVYGMIRR